MMEHPRAAPLKLIAAIDAGFLACIPLVGAIVVVTVYILGRFAKREDDHTKLFTDDISKFLEALQNATDEAIRHQKAQLQTHKTFEASRELVSTLRKEVAHIKVRLSQLLPEKQSTEWELLHLKWINSINGDSGLITRKTDAWGSHDLGQLESASSEYVKWAALLRTNVTRRKVKLR